MVGHDASSRSILPEATLAPAPAAWSDSVPRSSVRPGPPARSRRTRTWSTPWPATGVEAGRPRLARVEVAAEHHAARRPPSASAVAAASADVGLRARLGVRPAACRLHDPRRRARGARRAPRAARASGAACGRGARAIAVAAHEDRVGAAAAGLDEVGPALGDASGDSGSSQLRDVSARARARARTRGRARAATTAAPPAAARRPTPTRPAASANSSSSGARRVGHRAPVEEVPGQHAASRTYPPRLPRHFLTGSELSADELLRAARPRRRAEGRAALVARAARPHRRARLPEGLDAHAACPSRPASSSSAAIR